MDDEKLDMETALPGQIVYYESPSDCNILYGRILSIPDDRSSFYAEWYPSYDGYNGRFDKTEYSLKLRDGLFYPSVYVDDEAGLKQWEESVRKSREGRRLDSSDWSPGLLSSLEEADAAEITQDKTHGGIQITQDQAMDICRALHLACEAGNYTAHTENSLESNAVELRIIDLLKKLTTCYPDLKATAIYEMMEI